MRRFQFSWVVAGALAVTACGQGDSAGTFKVQDYAKGDLAKIDTTSAGSPLPTIPFESRSGKVTPADFKGSVIVLNLWATWCAPCVKELPALDRLQGAFNSNDVQVLLVSQDNQGWQEVDRKWPTYKMANLDSYIDPDMGYTDAFKTPGLPLTIIYDRQGREVGRVMKPVAWDGPDAKLLLTALSATR
jgi:thiol-disulfide isomerase/thioredoxin